MLISSGMIQGGYIGLHWNPLGRYLKVHKANRRKAEKYLQISMNFVWSQLSKMEIPSKISRSATVDRYVGIFTSLI